VVQLAEPTKQLGLPDFLLLLVSFHFEAKVAVGHFSDQ
jgi:hypothetical protein